ncbi:MAG TPA: hypothetical protein VLS25_11395 [Dehalococcoidia bacterium]|nr:hypothetical protein [Dehalococcoidia bacterium]
MILVVAAVAVAAYGVACGGDDNGGSNTATSAGASATGTPSGTGDASATPAEGKTPSNETPGASTPEPTTAGPRPTAAAEGTPAALISDPTGFLAENYPGKSAIDHDCAFSPVTQIATCEGFGRYAVDPPLGGQDISCVLKTIDGKPVLVSCTSQEPLQTIYYRVQE